jgi:hypothetical protein
MITKDFKNLDAFTKWARKIVDNRFLWILHYRKNKADMWYMIGIVNKGMLYETKTVSINKNGQVKTNRGFSSNSCLEATEYIEDKVRAKKAKGYYDITESNYPHADGPFSGLTYDNQQLCARMITKESMKFALISKRSLSDALEDSIQETEGEHSSMIIVSCVDNNGMEDDFTIGAEYVADEEYDGKCGNDFVAVYGNKGILREVFRERFEFQVEQLT